MREMRKILLRRSRRVTRKSRSRILPVLPNNRMFRRTAGILFPGGVLWSARACSRVDRPVRRNAAASRRTPRSRHSILGALFTRRSPQADRFLALLPLLRGRCGRSRDLAILIFVQRRWVLRYRLTIPEVPLDLDDPAIGCANEAGRFLWMIARILFSVVTEAAGTTDAGRPSSLRSSYPHNIYQTRTKMDMIDLVMKCIVLLEFEMMAYSVLF